MGLRNSLDITNLTTKVDEVRSKSPIYGAYWDKGSGPSLTRTHQAAGLSAAVGTDGAAASNDFDNEEIFREIGEVEDSLGNAFVRIPKLYIRKQDGDGFKTWQVSRTQYPGFYLPWCFWDFTNGRELPHIDVGKYKASLGAGDKLESKTGVYPLVNKTIVGFRDYARNNNTGGLSGYQQLDVHVVDMLRTLMFIEFATLDMQSIMYGFASGRYSSSDAATADTGPGNTIVVSNATGAVYAVGQAIGVGTSLGGNQRFYGRTITSIAVDTPSAGSTTISFDGDPVSITTGNILYNTGWKNGFSSAIAASSGSLTSNVSGLYPCVYRGIESPYGDVWQWVDGVNINEHQAWVTADAEDYASNVFASPYEQLGYANGGTNGYLTETGWDPDLPFVEFPTVVGGSSSTYYSDYYYREAGQRVALVGGSWYNGASAGPSSWFLSYSSAAAYVTIGGRLLNKPL